jgi:hypothetical protein
MMARGLDSSRDAAPVLWGGPPPVVEAGVEAEAEAVLERVAVETVVLEPGVGMAEAEAATELAALVMADAADERMLAATDAADDRAAEAEAKADEIGAVDPPVKGNWPE